VGANIAANWLHLECLQSVFQFSWTKFDKYLNKKIFDYLIVRTYVDGYYSSSEILTILDITCFLLTLGKKSKSTLTL
jgi:hypothetical protein